MAVIISVNNTLDSELQDLGHQVISKTLLKKGIYSARKILEECNIMPDFFIQKEHIGTRVLFNDIHLLSCKTAFWSIDTHINFFWQMTYSKMFDFFLTPHKAYIDRLSHSWKHQNTYRLPEVGYTYPWKAHSERKHSINFVGRLTGARPLRARMSNVLKKHFGTTVREKLSFQDMMALYTDTCIIPNESIAFETNFRLLEGASCGACVVTPHIEEDQNVLFEPNREILTYNNIDEFISIIQLCQKNKTLCESIGYAAWLRTRSEHTAIHRAKQLSNILLNGEMIFTNKNTSDIFFTLGIMHLQELLVIEHFDSYIEQKIDNQALIIALKLFSALKNKQMDDNLFAILFALADDLLVAQDLPLEDVKVMCAACGGAALYLGQRAKSQKYLTDYHRLCMMADPSHVDTAGGISLLWAMALLFENKQVLVGEKYIDGCCRSAADFGYLACALEPHERSWAEIFCMLPEIQRTVPLLDNTSLWHLVKQSRGEELQILKEKLFHSEKRLFENIN